MKIESKKRIIFLLSCLLAQSKGKVPCLKGFQGKENSVFKDEITDESCSADSWCARFEVNNMYNNGK